MELKDILKEKVELKPEGGMGNSDFELQLSHIKLLDELQEEFLFESDRNELETKFDKFVKDAINEKIERDLK